MSTTTTLADLLTVAGQCRLALQNKDFLSARQAACEMKVIMICLGSSVSASGTNFQFAIETASSLIGDVEKMQIYNAMLTSRGRLIRTGLSDGGRQRYGNGSEGVGGGVLHD